MNPDIASLKTPEQLLELALAKERQAHEFYEVLMAHSRIGILREFATQLKDEEYRHVKLLERKLSEMRMGRL